MAGWTTPRTWASGEFWTAALVNEQLRDNLITLTPVLGEYNFFLRSPTAVVNVIGTNWLECNGAAISRANYSALYNLMNGLRAARGSGSTTLGVALDSVATTLTIANYSDFWPGGRANYWTAPYAFSPFEIQIDSEKMLVTGRGNFPFTTLTVVRAREGTLAASHNLNATVTLAADMPFGSGDGVTTFNLPDLQGRTPWSAAPAGGHADVTTLGLDDRAVLAARRPKHRHAWETFAATAAGSQVAYTAGTLGTAGKGTASDTGDWPYQNYGLWIGPRDEGGPGVGRAVNTTPLDAPGYLVAGVWGIRFIA